MAAPLDGEQIEFIREFFTSPVAEQLFAQLEGGVVNDWVNCQDAAEREHLWRMLQVILLLKFTLRDAAAMKRLTERAQERRIYQS